ncbi:unnamed protein product [Penicillium pancosmium]
MPDRPNSPKILRGSMEHYGIITMTPLPCKAVTTAVLPNLSSGKLDKVSVFRIYYPGEKSQECGGLTDFENYCMLLSHLILATAASGVTSSPLAERQSSITCSSGNLVPKCCQLLVPVKVLGKTIDIGVGLGSSCSGKTLCCETENDMFATALLHGLPPSYRSFKEKYDWIRSTKPDDSPDLDYLFERMHVEEMHQLQIKEERKARDKAKEMRANSSTIKMDNPTRYRSRREDKSHLKCTYPGCAKTGHTEEYCWVKNPEKIPQSLREKTTTGPLSLAVWVV